ncbi:MAG: flavin reductase family protein [Clostridia bacterium]|nr:flavin reductase family protein [Clostridia bacterium]
MGRQNFKPGTLHAPLPAVMATVGDMENSNIITVAWTGILSSDPPRTYISVRPSRHSHKMLTDTAEFVINLTTERLAYATDYAGIYTGAKVDKFEKLGLGKIESSVVKAPTIAESPLALECKVFDVLHFGTHDVFMADIVNVSCDDSLLDANGKICLERAGLMAYSHGEYFALGEKIGKFGFSAAKETKRAASLVKSPKPTSAKKADDKNGEKERENAHVPFYEKYVKGSKGRTPCRKKGTKKGK